MEDSPPSPPSEPRRPANSVSATRYWLLPETRVSLAAATGCLMLGYDTGVIAGAILLIIPEYALEDRPELVGLVVSSCTMGAMVGTLVAGPSADALGRRPPLIAAGLLFLLGGAAMGWSPRFEVLVAGRFIAGMGIGAASSTVPVYISECASSARRGFLCTFPQLMGSTGILTSYVVVLVLMVHQINWRFMLLCSLPLALLQTGCAYSMPESPRWLLSMGRINEARESLRRLRPRVKLTHPASQSVFHRGHARGEERGGQDAVQDAVEQELEQELGLDGVEEELILMGNALVVEMGFGGGVPHVRAGGRGSRSASPTLADTRAGECAGCGSGSGSASRAGSVSASGSGDDCETDALLSKRCLEGPSRRRLECGTGGAPDLLGNRAPDLLGNSAHCLLGHSAHSLSLLASYRGAERRGSREGGVGAEGARQVHERAWMCLGGAGWRLVKSLRDMCLTPLVRKAMYISVGLQIWQQVSGVNAFVYYTPTVLKEAGVQEAAERICGITDPNAAAMVSTLLAYMPKLPFIFMASCLMDFAGRRSLLLLFVPVIALSLLALHCVLRFLPPPDVSHEAGGGEGIPWRGSLATVAIMLFGVSFVLSLGPVPCIITAELLPLEARSSGMSVAVAFQWATNAAVTQAFPSLSAAFGTSGVLLCFVSATSAAWVWIYVTVPETKGHLLEDASRLAAPRQRT